MILSLAGSVPSLSPPLPDQPPTETMGAKCYSTTHRHKCRREQQWIMDERRVVDPYPLTYITMGCASGEETNSQKVVVDNRSTGVRLFVLLSKKRRDCSRLLSSRWNRLLLGWVTHVPCSSSSYRSDIDWIPPSAFFPLLSRGCCYWWRAQSLSSPYTDEWWWWWLGAHPTCSASITTTWLLYRWIPKRTMCFVRPICTSQYPNMCCVLSIRSRSTANAYRSGYASTMFVYIPFIFNYF